MHTQKLTILAVPALGATVSAIARRAASSAGAGEQAGPGEIEAPFIFRKNGYYYLFASWG